MNTRGPLALADRVRRYEVFDGHGRLTMQVTAPPTWRVVGFGPATVYLVRREADDVEYLERYARAFRP